MKKILITLMLLSVCLWGTSYAAPITITSGNSTATIDPTSQAGMYNWTVDGVNNLYQQWFWYRIGSTGGQASVNTLGTPIVTSSSNATNIVYNGPAFQLTLAYTLFGGQPGSGTADISETIRINNTSRTPLALHFFQYSDFDLNGSFLGDVAWMSNPNVVNQFKPSTGGELSETTAIPTPTGFEINFFASTLNSLNSGSTYNLNDLPAIGVTLGPGDMTWAFQWDESVPAGGTLIISKDKHLELQTVPEPISLILLGSGLAGAGLYRRLRRPKG